VLKKRFLDDKKGGVQRGWKVWGMDVTKQGTSGVAAHVAGIVNSYLLNDADDGGNACSWYFISFTFDTTLGVIIGYILLHLLQEASKKAEWSSLQATGNYKRTSTTMSAAGQGCVEKDWCPTGVDGMVWFKQMISWCLITLVARAFVGCVLFLNRSWLVHIARVVAEPFTCEPTVLLVLVMLGCPLCLNALQLVRATPPPPQAGCSTCFVAVAHSCVFDTYVCALSSFACCRFQWVQDQFLKDADGSESKFDKWSKRCCGRGGGSEATDPLLPAGTQAGAFSTERIPTGFSSQNIQNIKGIYDGRQPSGSASLYSSE
jgi:hypothetical protein